MSYQDTSIPSSVFTSRGYIYDDCGVFNYYTSTILPVDPNMNTDNLIPVKYKKTSEPVKYGLIANKTLTDCVPSIVNKSDGSIDYSGLFAMLVNEIHVLKQQVAELQCRL